MKHITTIALALILHSSFLIPNSSFATQYSKLAVITEAKALGKWDAIKAWIQQSGYYDEWLVCQYLSDEHPAVTSLTNAIVSSGTVTSAELGAILAKSRDTSIPDAVLVAKYARDAKTAQGRSFWHGKSTTVTDVSNAVNVVTYEDGTVFRDPLTKTAQQRVNEANARLQKPIVTNGIPQELTKARLRAAANKTNTIEVTTRITTGR